MNQIDEKKYHMAFLLLWDRYSIRETAQIVGIAKETANRIQKEMREIYPSATGEEFKLRKGGYWERKDRCKKVGDVKKNELELI